MGRIFLLVLVVNLPLAFAGEREDYFSIQASFKDGFYALSLNAADAFLSRYPNSKFREDVLLIKGLSLYNLKRYPQALNILQELISSKDKRVKGEACYWSAKIYLIGKEEGRAQELFATIINEKLTEGLVALSRYELGLLAFKKENYEEALKWWEEVLRDKPPKRIYEPLIHNLLRLYLKKGDIKRAKEIIGKYLREGGPGYYYFNAELAKYRKDYEGALRLYDEILKGNFPQSWKEKAKVAKLWVYLDMGDYKGGYEELNTIGEVRDGDLKEEIAYLKPLLLYKQSEYVPAVRFYQRFISKFPESEYRPRAYLELVDCYYNLNKFLPAIKWARDFLEEYKDTKYAEQMHYLLGWVFYKKGELEKALEEFKWVSQNATDSDLKINSLCRVGDLLSEMGKLEEAIKQYDYVLQNYPDSLYAEYAQYQLGIDLLEKGDYEAAILALRALLTNFPKSTLLDKVHYHLALAHFKRGEFEFALEELNALLEGFPNSDLKDKALLQKAVLLYNQGKYKEASQLLKRYEGSKDHYVHFLLAKIYLKEGRVKDAQARYEWLRENIEDEKLLAYLYLQMGELEYTLRNWDRALRYYRKAYQLAEDEEVKEQALYWEAWCRYYKGDLDKAFQALKGLFQNKRIGEEARFYASTILVEMGKQEQAMELLKGLIQEGKRYKRHALLKLGNIYKDLSDYAKAIDCYKKLEGTPHDVISAEASFRLGEIYELEGKDKEALLQYLKVASLYNPGTKFVNKARLRSAKLLEEGGQIEEARRIYQELASSESEEGIYAKERLKELGQKQ